MRPIEKLKHIVENHSLLKHKALLNTNVDCEKKLIELILKEEYLISSNLVPMMALVLSRVEVDRPLTRLSLSENIWDEMGRGDDRLAHSQILKNVLASIDIQINNKHLKTTEDYNTYLWDFFKTGELSDCMAILAFSLEYLTLYEYKILRKRFIALGVTTLNIFFDANLSADIIHASNMGAALEREFPDTNLNQLYDAVESALEKRVLFYDGILNAIE